MQSINAARAESRRGLLLIMLAAVLWGTVGISTKTIYHLASTNPLSIGFFRLVFSLPVLFSICWARQGKEMLHVSRGDLGLMTLIGLLTGSLGVKSLFLSLGGKSLFLLIYVEMRVDQLPWFRLLPALCSKLVSDPGRKVIDVVARPRLPQEGSCKEVGVNGY
ncbi:EamA family transporter [Citrifermentans bemidjiense]|uniref:EamA family transporter n=1 Tax=Citrifermentans bemidjiense TaxID=225194 RepID=UPI00017BFABA|nr:EamA family transporter [Citrifermentans bemidjiense]